MLQCIKICIALEFAHGLTWIRTTRFTSPATGRPPSRLLHKTVCLSERNIQVETVSAQACRTEVTLKQATLMNLDEP